MSGVVEFSGRRLADTQEEMRSMVDQPNVGSSTVIPIEELMSRRQHRVLGGRVIGEISALSGRRQRRNEVLENLREQWWQAHDSGSKEVQRDVEEELGRKLGVRRGGQFIYSLRTAAELYERREKNLQGKISLVPFDSKPEE